MALMATIVLLLSVIGLIVGLIKPSLLERVFKDQKITRGKAALIFGALLVFSFVLFGLSPSDKQPQPTSQNTIQPAVTQPSKPVVIFDIPPLVGKNIDEVRVTLGKPVDKDYIEPTDEQKKLGANDREWSNSFKKDGHELLVTFIPQSRKIVDFFISTDDSSGATKDTQRLLDLGNLKQNDPSYTIDFVKAMTDSSVFTGVKVIPKK